MLIWIWIKLMSINILKKQKVKHSFTTVYNSIIDDKELTLRDMGLYVYMLSKPDEWHFSTRSIASQRTESKDTIAKILNNLISKGWLKRNILRNKGKYYSYVYEILYVKEVNTPSYIQDTPSSLSDTENKTLSNNYYKKEREGFFDVNKKAINIYISELLKNDKTIKSKEAYKKTLIQKFIKKDKATIEVFKNWKLNYNILQLEKLYRDKKYNITIKEVTEIWSLSSIKKTNFEIVANFTRTKNNPQSNVRMPFNTFDDIKKYLQNGVLKDEE